MIKIQNSEGVWQTGMYYSKMDFDHEVLEKENLSQKGERAAF